MLVHPNCHLGKSDITNTVSIPDRKINLVTYLGEVWGFERKNNGWKHMIFIVTLPVRMANTRKEKETTDHCYLAAPRPTLGHYRGESLTHPMLITAFYIFDPKVTGSLVTRLVP